MKKNINPLVSIIVNCHNGSTFLDDCVKSILRQTYKNWELIFWDNKSSDNSFNIIKKFKDKRIKRFKSKSFYTLYKSRNLALKKCKGKYISFLDADDMWIKDKLKDQVREISKDSLVKMVYSNYYVLINKTKNKYLKHKKILPSGSIAQKMLSNYDIGIITTLVDKKIFEKKKFNISYNIIGDFDLFLNLCIKHKVLAIQKPHAIYRRHDDNFSSKRIDLYILELSRWIKQNYQKKIYKNYSFIFIKILLLKLKIKYLIYKIFKLRLGV